MNEFNAADLPDSSVVGNADLVYIKNHPMLAAQWRGTDGSYASDREIDLFLSRDAEVLRVGAGGGVEVEIGG